jgi:excinuclease ABC subunit A
LIIRHNQDDEEETHFLSRLTDSVETALKFGEGYLTVHRVIEKADEQGDKGEDIFFSEHLACPTCGISLPEIEPRTFSFNTPHGACPVCQGMGGKLEVDTQLLIPDWDVSLKEGAIILPEWNGPREEGGYYWQVLEAAAKAYHIDLDAPLRTIPKEKLDILLYGTQGREITIHYHNRNGREATFRTPFEGVIPNLERRYNETNSEYIRSRIAEYMTMKTCPACHGDRLRPEALAVTVAGSNIVEVTRWHVLKTLEWVHNLMDESSGLLDARQRLIAERIFKELTARLGFLVDVGLDYLTLSRLAGTLSGGEAQRIRLATQIGSKLMGVLYVLDEPSIGLHHETTNVVKNPQGMESFGQTVIVVEHDEETIRNADWIIDMGPGAGEHGGRGVAQGTLEQILSTEESQTGAYLSGKKVIPVPSNRRTGMANVLLFMEQVKTT